MQMQTALVKLTGCINWVWGTADDVLNVPVKRALLRSPEEIVLDCESEGWQYNVSLKRTGAYRFEGKFDTRQGQKVVPVSAFCTLYSNNEGYLLVWKVV